ncbi:LysR family transcriptional regulator, glycine cleavage system transcriptional activator [Bosea sp. CRIB-10]|uniref:LysR substrate-binding domain-containing protein n=1 Tax=Bosea sp. CRIB-10 TaxID=378404 RepID=UPI0008EE3B08|nr:LysR substrate-binding domain-containing protein [Bosea sp. CRIB-10]SFC88423.1 LysR family transcriptional regulator, glycine cleavage system transcriptional activator [Bosea sp. CRIB-10]
MPVKPPRPALPPLNALRAFEAAARLGSFSKAAEEIGVTQGAIAQQIRHLEAFLGLTLFRRLPQGVALTEAAQEARPRLSAAFDALALIVQELKASHAGRALTIAALPCIAQLWLSPRLPALQQAFPGLAISINAMEEPPTGRHDSFDLALFYLAKPPAGSLALDEDSLFPICTPALAGKLRTPVDLAGQTLLHDAVWRGDWARWLRHAGIDGIDPGRGPSYSLYALALDAVLGGAGILIGRKSLVAPYLADGRLVAPFAEERPTGDKLTLLFPPAGKPHPRRADVVAWLEANG